MEATPPPTHFAAPNEIISNEASQPLGGGGEESLSFALGHALPFQNGNKCLCFFKVKI